MQAMSSADILPGATETQQMRVLVPAGVSGVLVGARVEDNQTDERLCPCAGSDPIEDADHVYPRRTERDGSTGLCGLPCGFDKVREKGERGLGDVATWRRGDVAMYYGDQGAGDQSRRGSNQDGDGWVGGWMGYAVRCGRRLATQWFHEQ
jgi:hypothetical protein